MSVTFIVYGFAEPRKVVGTAKVEPARMLPLASVVHELRVSENGDPPVPCAVAEHVSLAVKPDPLTVTVNPTTADAWDKEIEAAACTGGRSSAGLYGVW